MLRLAILSDLHIEPSLSSGMMTQQVIAELNQGEFDHVVTLGDLTRTGSDVELEYAKNILDEIQFPNAIIPGNHETAWSNSACLKWLQLFGTDRVNVSVGGYRLVGINSGYYMHNSQVSLRKQDMEWLETVFSTLSPEEELIFLIHSPFDADEFSNYRQLAQLLLHQPTALILSGHLHRNVLYRVGDIPQISVRHLTGKMKNDSLPGPAYTIIELDDEQIRWYDKVYEKEPSLVMELDRHHPELWSNPICVDLTPFEVSYPKAPYTLEPIYDAQDLIHSSIGVSNDTMVFGTDKGILMARSITTGEEKWRFSCKYPIYSTPCVTPKMTVIGTTDSEILGLDTQTGACLWKWKTAGPVAANGTISEDGIFYVGDTRGFFYAIRVADGKYLYCKRLTDQRFQAAPVIQNDRIYINAWDSFIYAIERETGNVLWRWSGKLDAKGLPVWNCFPMFGESLLAVTENRLFYSASSRTLYSLDIETGELLWGNTNELYYNVSLLSQDGNFLIVKTADSKLLAIPIDSNDGTASKCVKLQADSYLEVDTNSLSPLETEALWVTGSGNGWCNLIDKTSFGVLSAFRIGECRINTLAQINNKQILIACLDGTIWKLNLL